MDLELIRSWKKAYGNIYTLSSGGVDYVFRALTFREFDELRLTTPDVVDAEEDVVALGLIYPFEGPPANAPAGVFTVLAQEIMEVSGFGSPQRMREMLENQRALAATNVRTVMKAYVLSVMSSYTEEKLDEFSFDELAKKVALAELIVSLQQQAIGIEGHEVRVQIIDPEEEARKLEEEKQKYLAQKKPGTAGFDDPIAAKLYSALSG